jgi:hypothetical protein
MFSMTRGSFTRENNNHRALHRSPADNAPAPTAIDSTGEGTFCLISTTLLQINNNNGSFLLKFLVVAVDFSDMHPVLQSHRHVRI